MKTIVCWIDWEGIKYFRVDGDHTHLDQKYYGMTGNSKEDNDAINALLWNEEGEVGIEIVRQPKREWFEGEWAWISTGVPE